MRRILKRLGFRILPVLYFFVIRSHALADMAWDPAPGQNSAEGFSSRLILIMFLCIIGPVWLYAKAVMLKHFDGTGWRILIPLYGRYLEYRYYWDTGYFLINIIIIWAFIASVIVGFFTAAAFPGFFILVPEVLLICWVMITVRMRMKTMEAFGQNKLLGLLELLGLGFVLDCFCAITCLRMDEEKKLKEKQAQQQAKTDQDQGPI